MKNIYKFILCIALALSLSIVLTKAQTGGGYEITQSVIAGGGGQNSAGGTFALDGTIGQAIAGGALEGSPFAVTSGFWNFTPLASGLGFEADVAGRPNGDGEIQSNDVVQVQRFLIGLDLPFQANEFQRADSAPFSSRGDGQLQSNDVVQAQRYQIGLEQKQLASGPTAPGGSQPLMAEESVAKASADDWQNPSVTAATAIKEAAEAPAAPRELRVESTVGFAGQAVMVNILVDALGDESAYGFRLAYTQAILTNPSVAIGTAGGSRLCNTATPGQINCSVNNFPNNNPASSTDQIGEIQAGNNQLLVKITFTIAATAPSGTTSLTLSNVNASNDAGQSLAITPTPPATTSGTVTINAPTAALVSVSGRVLTPQGRGIRNVVITMTDSSGNVRMARTTGFGYYQFRDVAAGETYVFTATGKRFSFGENAQVHSVTEDTDNINFVANEQSLSP